MSLIDLEIHEKGRGAIIRRCRFSRPAPSFYTNAIGVSRPAIQHMESGLELAGVAPWKLSVRPQCLDGVGEREDSLGEEQRGDSDTLYGRIRTDSQSLHT